MRHPNRDAEHLAVLRDDFAQNRRIPPYQRIAALLGFASRAAAVKLLQRLAAAGFVTRTPDNRAWMPTPQFFARPLAQAGVRAGVPTMVTEVGSEPLLLDQYLVRQPNRTVLIPVRGDSMREAGIFDGDLAVVERTTTAPLGSFVVALIDGEYTLKELIKQDGAYALKPHHAGYPLLRPQGELQLVGVLVGLVRRYLP